MAYTISYVGGKKRSRRGLLLVMLVLTALLATAACRQEIRVSLQQMLLPGNAASAAAAWQDLTRNLRDGSYLPDAVATFCQSVWG